MSQDDLGLSCRVKGRRINDVSSAYLLLALLIVALTVGCTSSSPSTAERKRPIPCGLSGQAVSRAFGLHITAENQESNTHVWEFGTRYRVQYTRFTVSPGTGAQAFQARRDRAGVPVHNVQGIGDAAYFKSSDEIGSSIDARRGDFTFIIGVASVSPGKTSDHGLASLPNARPRLLGLAKAVLCKAS